MNTLRRYRVSLGGLMAALVALWQITQPLSMTAATIIKADNNTNIDQGSSWTGGVVPNSIDIASFDGTIVTTGSGTLVMATDLDFAGLLVTNPSEAITIGGVGRTLTLTGLGGVANAINLGGATQDLSLNMDILRLLGATQTWNVASGRTLSIGAGLRGTTNVTLSGAGTVELTGNSIATTIAGLPTNLYTGSLTVSSGVTLVAKNSNALGGNVITGGNTTVASGGSLTFDATGGPIVNLEALSLTGTGVGNNGALRHIAGTTILNGQITLTGSVEIQADAGYLEINQAETAPNVGASSIVSTAISPTVTYDVASGARIRQAGVVATPTTSGTLNVVKNGDGILQLDGANTFTGGVQLNAGTLRIGNASGLGTAASGLTIANGTTLSMSDGVSRTLLNGITVNGDFTLGETTVGTGALTLSGTVALGAANRTITVVRGSNGIVAQNISGIISATGAFGIVQAGNGFLNLSGASTFSGGYTIGTGATTLFGISSTGTPPSLTAGPLGTGTVTMNAGSTLAASASSLTLGNAIVMSGDVSFDQMAGSVAGFTLSGTVNLGSADRTITTLNPSTSNPTVLSGVVSNTDTSKGLIKDGQGTLTLNNASNTFGSTGGGVTVNAGILNLSGGNAYTGATLINAGGTLSVGATGGLGSTSGITVASGGVLNINAVTVTAAPSLTLNGTGIGATGALTGTGTAQFNGGVILGSNASIGGASGVVLTLTGVVSDGGSGFSLTKVGAGTLALTGASANTFTGLTIVNAGTLNLGKSASTDAIAGNLQVNAGTVNINANEQISNASSVTVTGGTLALGTSSETVAVLTVSGGTVSSSTGTLTSTGGYVINGGGAIAGANVTISAILGGSAGLTKTGATSLTLSGVNTFTGAVNIEGGTLQIAADSGLGAVPGAATPGAITLNNLGNLQLTANGAINTNRGIQVNANGGILSTAASVTLTYGGAIAGSGPLFIVPNATSGVVTLTGTTSSTGTTIFQTTSAGTLNLSGASSVVNGAFVLQANGGTVTYTAANQIADTGAAVTAIAGTLSLATFNDTIATLNLLGATVSSTTGVLTVSNDINAQNGIISAILGGSAGLTMSGNRQVTLSGVNTYTGKTAVNGGVLSIAAESGLGTAPGAATADQLSFNGGTLRITGATVAMSANRGVTINAGGGTIDTNGTATNVVTIAGVLTGSGPLTKINDGVLALTGANNATYSGTINVLGGVLRADQGVGLPTASVLNLTNGVLEITVDNTGRTAGTDITLTGVSGFSNAGAAGRTVTLNGGTGLTWGSGGFNPSVFVLQMPSAATQNLTFTNDIDLNGAERTVQNRATVAGSSATLSGALTNGTLVIRNADDVTVTTLSGTVANTARVIVNGGTVNLSKTGVNAVGSGGLLVTTQGLPAAGFAVGSASLVTLTASNQIDDAAIVTVLGINTVGGSGATLAIGANSETIAGLNIGTATTFAGQVTIGTGGTLTVLGNINFYNARDATANSSAHNLISGTTTATLSLGSAGRTIRVFSPNAQADSDSAINAIIAGTAGSGNNAIIKTGNRVLVLTPTGVSTYTGITSITEGAIQLAGATAANVNAALGAGGAGNQTVVSAGAALEVNNGTAAATIAELLTLNGFGNAGNGAPNSGALRMRANLANIWSGAITLGSDARINVDSNTTTLSGGINATNAGTRLFIGGAGTTTIGTNIIGSNVGLLVKDGAGTLNLGNLVHTFTGGILINQGVVVGGSADTSYGPVPGAVDADYFTLNGGTLRNNAAITINANRGILVNELGGTLDASTGTLTYGGAISGTGLLTKAGTQNLAFTSTTTVANDVSLTAGTITLAANNQISTTRNLYMTGGTLALGAFNQTFNRLVFNGGTISGTGTLTVNGIAGIDGFTMPAYGTQATFSANLTGAQTVTKIGGGVLELGGTNTQTGNTLITGTVTTATGNLFVNNQSGTLRYTAASALSAGSNINISGGGTLSAGADLNGASAGDFSFALGTGAGQVQFTGSGGFSARSAARTFNLGGAGGTVTWDSGSFVPSGGVFLLGLDAAAAGETTTFANAIDLNAGTRTIFADGAATIDALLSGAITNGSLIKAGGGRMDLTADNTLAGTVTLRTGYLLGSLGGELRLNGAGLLSATTGITLAQGTTLTLDNATNNTNRINNSATLTSEGGTFTMLPATGAASTSYSETIGTLILSKGLTTINTTQALATFTSALTFAGVDSTTPISRTEGSTIVFAGTGLGADARNTIGFSGVTVTDRVAGTDPFDISFVGGWATLGNDFVKYGDIDPASGTTTPSIVALSGSDYVTTTGPWLATDNVKIDAAASVTTSDELKSIILNQSVARTVTISAGQTLRVESGGVMVAGNFTTTAFTGGNLTAGVGTAAGELVFTINSAVANPITIASAIVNNNAGAAAVAVTKTGIGALVLTGTNTYTGNTYLNAGQLRLGTSSTLGGTSGSAIVNGPLGTGTINLNAGALSSDSATARTLHNSITITGNGVTLGDATNTGVLNLLGAVNLGSVDRAVTHASQVNYYNTLTLTGGATFNKLGSGLVVLLRGNTAVGSIDAPVIVSAGQFQIESGNVGSATTGITVLSGAALGVGGTTANNTILNNEPIILNGTGVSNAGALRSVGGYTTVGAPISLGSASRINSDLQVLKLSGTITGNDQSLILGGAGNIELTGTLNLGVGQLTKADAGILYVSGAVNTAQDIIVSGGSVLVRGGGNFGSNIAGQSINVAAGASVRFENAANFGSNQTVVLQNNNATNTASIGFGSGWTNQAIGFNTSGTGAANIRISSPDMNAVAVLLDNATNFSTDFMSSAAAAYPNAEIWFGATNRNGVFTGTTLTAGIGNTYRLGAGGGLLTIAGTNALTGNNGLMIGSRNGFAITGLSGSVMLNAAQNFVGGIQVNNGGTLIVTSNAALGNAANAITMNAGGTLNLRVSGYHGSLVTEYSGRNITFASDAGGNVALNVDPFGGTQNARVQVGTINLNGGQRGVAINASNGIDLVASSINIGGSGIADANNNVTITNTGLMTVTGGITETAGSGIGIFIKAGAGTLIIEGNSTYSGTTIVTAGTLALAHTGAAGTAGSGIIMTGGVLDLRSNAAGTTTFDFGTLFLGASATVNVDRLSTAGGVNNTIAFDTLDTQAFGVAGGTLTVNGGHGYGLRINNSVLMRGNLTISNVALVELAGGLQDTQSLYTGSGRFNFTKTGVGVLTISGASTYDGDTDIQVGTLVIKHDQALGINTNAINMTANSYSRILVDGTRTISRDITMGGTSTKVIGNLGTGTATFSGIITLNADAGNNFYADTGGTVVLGGSLIGTDPVNKTGLGTLQINGPSTGTGNPFSGTFTQAHGTTIGTAQSVGGSPFGFNNNLVVQSGAFQLNGLSGQSTLTQTTGSFTLGGSGASGASGANLIVRDFAVGADTFTTTFAIGSLTRANLGTGVFIPHQGNGEEILRIQTSPGLVNGILAPWLVKTTSDANRDADFVTLDGSNNVVTATYTSADVNAANTNVSIVNDTDGGTLTATRNAYGLRLGADLDLDGNTLNIGEGITAGTFGGLILNNGADITGGTLNFGASEGLVYVEAGQTSTISATIAPFITGSGPTSNSSFNGLIKFGNGTLELSGSGVNGMRGSVYVNQGTLSLTASNVLPTYTFANQIRGATLSVNSGATVNFNGNAQSLEAINSDYGSVINLGSATVTVGYNNQSSTLVGQITGTAGSTIIKVGTGTLTLSNTRGDVANSGLTNIFVDSGGLTIIAPSSSGSSSGTTQVFGAPFAVAPSLDISTNVILRGGSLNLRTDGDNTTSAESIDYGLNITVMGANSILTTDRAGQLGATAATKNILLGNLTLSQHQLTVTNTNTVIPIIRGTTTLTNDALINTTNELFLDGVIQGGFSLNKSGGGNLFINNSANTFTGALVVNAGTLLFGTRGPDELRYAGQTFVPSDTARAGTGPIVINPAAIIRINDSGNIGSNQQLIVQSSTLGSASMVELRSDVALSTLNLRTFGAPTIALNMNDGFYQQNIDLARIGNGFGGLSQGSGGTATTNFTGTIGAGANNTYRFFGTNGGNFNIMNANALTGTASVEFGRSANILGSGPSNVSAFNYRFITDQDYTGSTIIHRTVGAGTVGGSVIVRGSLATSTIENYGILTLEGMGTFTNAAGTQVNTYIARPGSSLVLNYNTNINAGVFQPNGLNNAAAFVNKWQDNLGVVINGSQFQLTSTNGTTITEQVGAVTINQGAEIFLNSVNTNSQTVLLMDGAIVRNTGATLTIRTAGTSQLGSTATLGSRLMFVDPTTQLSGAATRGVVSGQTIAMVAPWIFNISDNTFVDYSPTNTTGFTAAAFTSTITAGGSQAGIGTGGTGIVDITTAAITALTATSDIYALRASQNITGTSAIQIRSGGVIINGTTVIDAPLTFNNGTSDIEAVLHTPSALTLANIITASGITKNGIGALTISGNNSTTLTAGELITVNGGTLQLNGGTTAVTFVPVAGKATVVLNGNYLNNNAAMMPVLQLRANGSTFFGTTAAAVDSINLTIGDNVPYAQISSDRSDATSSNGTFTIGNLVVNAGTGTDGTILEFAQGNGYDFSVGGTTTLNGSAPVSFVINTSNNTDNIVTLTGAMSGSNRLIVTGNNSFLGSAILRLSAANSSFSGAITIAGGTLEGRNVSSFGNGTNRIELMQGQLNLRNDTNNATFATAGLTISGGSSIAPTRISVDRVSANNPNLNLGSAGATHRTENSAVIMFGQGNDVRLTFTGATFTVTDNPVFAQSNLNSIGASVFFDTIVQGSGHIIKTGGGTYGGTNNLRMAALVFNNAAANTFSGGLDVQGGGVRAGNATTKLGSGAITLAPGTQLDLADAGNVGGFIGTTAVAGVTKFYSNSTALATVSIRSAINVDPHSLLPASAVVSRSDVGGIFAIGNGVTYSTALDMSSLFNGMWFLGGGTGDGTYGATTLGVAADDVFRLGGGGGYLTLSAGTSLTDAGGTVAANRVLVGSPYSMAGGRGVIFAGDNSYSGGTTISRIRTTDLINGNLLGTQIAEVFVRGANASNLSTAITRAFGTGHVENYGLIQFDSVNSSAVNGFGVGAANVNTYSFHSGSRLLFANTGTQPDSRFAEGYWNDSTGVALRGSSIEFTGNDAPDIHNREVMGAVTFTAGSEISVRRENTGGWGELVLASLARVGSGTLTLDSNGGVAPWGGASGLDTTRLIVTTAGAAQTNTNGMVAAYIISRNGNQFVKYDSTNGYQLITTGGNPANYVAYTGASNTTILPSALGRADQTQMLNDGTEIFDITGTGTNGENWTLGSNLDVWAFREGINGNANVVAGGATANTITIRGGGALFGNTGVNDQTWRVNLTFKDASNVLNEGLIYTGFTRNLTVEGIITAGSVTKFGSTALTLSQDNQVTGAWNLNEGVLQLTTPNALGFNNNVLNLNGAYGGQFGTAVPELRLNPQAASQGGEPFVFNMGATNAYEWNHIRLVGSNDRITQMGDLNLRTYSAGQADLAIPGIITMRVDGFRQTLRTGLVTLHDHYMLDIQSTSFGPGSTAAVQFGSGTAPVNQFNNQGLYDATKIGDGLLILGDNSGSFTNRTFTVNEGAVRVLHNGSFGAGSAKAIIDNGGALEIAVSNYVSTAALTQREGSIERWAVSNARASGYTFGSGVHWQLLTDVSSGTYNLNGGSLMGYLPVDFDETLVTRTIGSGVTLNLAASSFLGQPYVAGSDNSASAGGNGAALVGGNALQAFYDMGKGNRAGNTPLNPVFSGAYLRILGDITGAFDLTKVGQDVVLLGSSNNSYNNTIIREGVLQVGVNNALPVTKRLMTTANGILDLYGNNQTVGSLSGDGGSIRNSAITFNTLTVGGDNTSTSYTGVLSGNVALVKTGTGTLTLGTSATSGFTNDYAGGTTVTGGTLSISADINLGFVPLTAATGLNNLILNGGTLATTATMTLSSTRGFQVGASGGSLNVASGTVLSYAGAATGTGTLTKKGLGTYSVSGNTALSGGLDIQQGAVQVSGSTTASTNTATSGALTVSGGAVLTVSDPNTGDAFTTTATFGSLARSGRGTLTFVPANNSLNVQEFLAFTTPPTTTNGIIAPWAVRASSSGSSAGDFLGLSAGNVVTATYTSTDITSSTSTDVVNQTTAAVLSGSAQAYALKLTSSSIAMAGNTLTLGDGTFAGLILNGGAGLTDGTLALSTGEGLVYVDSAADSTIQATITGSNGLTKFGAGRLILSGNNTYTGTTNVNQGTLLLNGTTRTYGPNPTNPLASAGGSNLGASSSLTVLNGAAVEFFDDVDIFIGGSPVAINLAGTGVSGNGALRYRGNADPFNRGSGDVTGNVNGVITLTDATRIQSDAGTLRLNGAINAAGFDLTLGGLGNIRVAGVLALGTGGLTKDGTGTLELRGNNTYSGDTTVSAGIVALSHANGLGSTGGATTVATGAVLAINGVSTSENIFINGTGLASSGALVGNGNVTTPILSEVSGNVTMASASSIGVLQGGILTISGVLGDNGGNVAFSKVGAGTLILSGANTYEGATSVLLGTLQLSGSGRISNNATTVLQGTLDLNGISQGIQTLTLGGLVTDGSLTSLLNIGAGGSLALGGDVTVTYAANTSNEGAQITAGTLNLGFGNRTFTVGDSFFAETDLLVSSVIAGGNSDVGIIKAGGGIFGVMKVTGTNTFGGSVQINAGILEFSTASNLGVGNLIVFNTVANNTGRLRFASGNTTDISTRTLRFLGAGNALVDTNGNNVIFANPIGDYGPGGLTKLGTGTLTLQGANTYSGTTNVQGGTLILSGANGAVDAASNLTLANGAALTLDNTTSNNTDRIVGTLTSTGGVFNFNHGGAASTNYREEFGALTLTTGQTTFNLSQAAASQTSVVTTLSGARTAGATAMFAGTGLGTDTRNQFVFTTIPTLQNGVLPWAVVNSGSLISLATGASGTSLAPLALAAHNQGSETTWVAASNARPTADVTVTAARSLNTLTLDNGIDLLAPLADRTITFATLGTVLQTGGSSIIGASGTNEHVLAFGTAEAIFYTIGDLVIQRGDTGNITGSGGMTKAGAGTLTIAQNAVTGTVRLNEGTYRALGTQATAFGNGTVTFDGGSAILEADGGVNYARAVTALRDATITVQRTTAGAGITHTLGTLAVGVANQLYPVTLTIAEGTSINNDTAYGVTFGNVTLATYTNLVINDNGTGKGTVTTGTIGGAFTLAKQGSGDLALNGAATSNIDIQEGRVVLGTVATQDARVLGGLGGVAKITGTTTLNGGTASYLGDTTITGGQITLGVSDVLPNGIGKGNLALTAGTFSLGAGFSDTINGLSGAGSVTNASGTSTLTVGDGNASATFSGLISGAGMIHFVKTGTGTQNLTGTTNSYTGTTTVDAGILRVGIGSTVTTARTGSGALAVKDGGEVQGTGIIGGTANVTNHVIQIHGVLRPGDSTLTGASRNSNLTINGNLILENDSYAVLEISSATVHDNTILTILDAAYQANDLSIYTAYRDANLTSGLNWNNAPVGVNAHDTLTINGSLTLGTSTTNNLVQVADNGYLSSASVGDIVDLADWATTFNLTAWSTFNVGTNFRQGGSGGGDLELPTLGEGLAWDVGAFTSHGILVVVPEPGRMMLLLLGMLGLFFRRRRKN